MSLVGGTAARLSPAAPQSHDLRKWLHSRASAAQEQQQQQRRARRTKNRQFQQLSRKLRGGDDVRRLAKTVAGGIDDGDSASASAAVGLTVATDDHIAPAVFSSSPSIASSSSSPSPLDEDAITPLSAIVSPALSPARLRLSPRVCAPDDCAGAVIAERAALERSAAMSVFHGLFGSLCVAALLGSCTGRMDAELRNRVMSVIRDTLFPAGPAVTAAPSSERVILREWHEYVSQRFVYALVQGLVGENLIDDSPRLALLQAAYESLPHSRPMVQRALVETIISICEQRAAEVAEVADAESDAADSRVLRGVSDPPRVHTQRLFELLAFLVDEFVKDARNPAVASSELLVQQLHARAQVLARALSSATKNSAVLSVNLERVTACAEALVRVCPAAVCMLFRDVSRFWPRCDAAHEALVVQFVGRMLQSTPPGMLAHSAPMVQRSIIGKLAAAARSLHADVSRNALAVCGNTYVMVHFIAPSAEGKAVANALVANQSHWDAQVRQQSEHMFEQLLDLN